MNLLVTASVLNDAPQLPTVTHKHKPTAVLTLGQDQSVGVIENLRCAPH